MKGFTLLELLVGLALTALILTVGIPALTAIVSQYSSDISTMKFKSILTTGRVWALTHEQNVTICPLISGRCASHWNTPPTIFTDSNLNSKLDDHEHVIYEGTDISIMGNWQKKKSDQPYVRFNGSGHAFGSATTFIYCSDSGNTQYARQIIISFQGRLKSKSYLNKNGSAYSNLNNLACPTRTPN